MAAYLKHLTVGVNPDYNVLIFPKTEAQTNV